MYFAKQVLQAQCRVFTTTFNPQQLRLGNKILRQRLRGPALAAWYPRKTVSFRDLQDAYQPLGLTIFDEAEDDREEAIQVYVAIPSTVLIFSLFKSKIL
jgi:small subunit ribosomal protein S33